MKEFKNIIFHGTFREYQQTVLNNVSNHLKDRKVHIVAAPGSGKTILGLELIRRLNEPAIIFSPSITIRQQWGERFKEKFLDESQNVEEYVSYNLTDINLITSVTYQSLHAAFNREIEIVNDNELYEDQQEIDYSRFNLIETIKKNNIKTICLDEAHHLRSEWQKVLEEFLEGLGDDITLISLTATPPYDSSPGEWKKYITLCGEIDEEIFIPELVSQGTLCPHQDYIYFNYPTKPETESLKEYKETVIVTINEIINGQSFKSLMNNIYKNHKEQQEIILKYAKEYVAILCLANFQDANIPTKLIKLVSPSGKLPRFKSHYAEIAFQYIIDHPKQFTPEISNDIKHVLKSNGLIERRKVKLKLNDKLNRLLISSVGKLNSIVEITKSEYKALDKELRMLILTDYIKRDMVKFIGTSNMPNSMGIVSIFERIREELNQQVPIGVLSGSLIIVPNNSIDKIKELSCNEGIDFSISEIPHTSYSEIQFRGSNKHKVRIITQIFQLGYINILIGTKSLLGEGWDSPCINSLILASFVGSFMLSNQMRGRAIRTDITNPNKTANIWHLATLEPKYIFENSISKKLFSNIIEDQDEIVSQDYETLKRRFNGFLGPAYHSGVIESGIDRIEIIKPPFDYKGIERINREMLELAYNREGIKQNWNKTLHGNIHPEIMETSEIPTKVWPKKFVFINLLNEFYLCLILITLIRGMIRVPLVSDSFMKLIIYIVIILVIIYFMIIGYIKILKYISPVNTIKTLSNCVLNTLKEIGEIQSNDSKILVKSEPLGLYIHCSLEKATVHEKRVFADAMKELLTSIDNPRYLLIKKGLLKLKYGHSFACPSIIGVNKENAKIFQDYLEKATGNMKLIYTRSENGRKYILKCRRWSYINLNENYVYNKKRVNKWE